VKGQSGNPAGRKPISDDVKIARKITQYEFERICSQLFFMSVRRLEEVVADDKTPVMKALVARILIKGIEESSRVELNYFIERFLGKVSENHNFTGNLNTGLADFIASRAGHAMLVPGGTDENFEEDEANDNYGYEGSVESEEDGDDGEDDFF
jgi:hypothetical protein